MGLAFHYSGRMRQYEQIDTLVEEMTDVCREMHWSYTIISDDQLKGILLNAPESEALWFTFTPDGKTCSVPSLQTRERDDPYFSTVHVKTQYAGPETHMVLIKLLRHVSNKYFSEIEVMDEGEYWEKGDEENLRRIFDNYTRAINMFAEMLQGMEHIPGESPESLAARIEKLVKDQAEGVEVVVVTNDQAEPKE